MEGAKIYQFPTSPEERFRHQALKCQRLLALFPPGAWFRADLGGAYATLLEKADELATEGVELGLTGHFVLDSEGSQVVHFDPDGKRFGTMESLRTGEWDVSEVGYEE
jgi:hypothetical protein